MIKFYLIVTIFISLSFPSKNLFLLNLMNEKSDWVYDYVDDDIKVFVMNNDSLPIIKLEKTVQNVEGLFEIILNVENYNNVLTERTLTSEYLGEIVDTTYGYQITKNYIPFTKNRHLIFKMYAINDNRIEWYLVGEKHPYFIPYKKRRSKELIFGGGAWQIVELDSGKYKLIHYLYIDPRLKMPKFLLNSVTKKSVLKVFKDVLNSYHKIK